jgi:integrase/recombinase XerD
MSDSVSVLARWEAWLSVHFSQATVDGYSGAAYRFFRVTKKPLSDISENDVVDWLESFPYRSASRVTYYNALKSLFGFAVRHGELERNPMTHVHVKAPEPKEPEALSEEQCSAVIAAAYAHNPLHGYATEFLFYSGGRVSEITHARWEDVSSTGLIFRTTKNGKDRRVPWSPGLVRAIEGLRSYFGDHERILPRSNNAVWTWVKTAGIRAGIQGVHPHLFRSTAITIAADRGARLDHVQAWVGHSKLATTQRYRKLNREEVDAVGQMLDLGEGTWQETGTDSASGSARTSPQLVDSLSSSGSSSSGSMRSNLSRLGSKRMTLPNLEHLPAVG